MGIRSSKSHDLAPAAVRRARDPIEQSHDQEIGPVSNQRMCSCCSEIRVMASAGFTHDDAPGITEL